MYLRLPRLGAGCGAEVAGAVLPPPRQCLVSFACSVAGALLGLGSLGPPAALMSMEEEPAAEDLGTGDDWGLEKGAQLSYYGP